MWHTWTMNPTFKLKWTNFSENICNCNVMSLKDEDRIYLDDIQYMLLSFGKLLKDNCRNLTHVQEISIRNTRLCFWQVKVEQCTRLFVLAEMIRMQAGHWIHILTLVLPKVWRQLIPFSKQMTKWPTGADHIIFEFILQERQTPYVTTTTYLCVWFNVLIKIFAYGAEI